MIYPTTLIATSGLSGVFLPQSPLVWFGGQDQTAESCLQKGLCDCLSASAYRSGEKVKNEQTGKLHDYSRRQGVIHSEIIAPTNAPEWTKNRSQLWNAVEASEKRKDSRVAREVEISLPRELNTEQNLGLVRDFVQTQFVDMGMVADVALHSGEAKDGGQNPHSHILLTTREINTEINPDDSPADVFGQKNRGWNSKEQLQEWRKNWQECANNHLGQAGETEPYRPPDA